MSDLDRFVAAQDAGGTYDQALTELRAGRKTSHWMWFVFPQLAGLGRSETARRYAVQGLEEARAYLAHPVLGDRLRECTRALLDDGSTDAVAVLGAVDAVKLRSCATLFAHAAAGTPDAALFEEVLRRFYGDEPDATTIRVLWSTSS
ncbi:DUF1810 domain-containing protein [Kineococcus rubinsiae]|uniref:DUF1810 domain-containing protein n=1 Tax=Kineococcus rubinsiae TaxID=2609562 RepID=UPI00143019AC|nr:DUF1810 domain-containing protein [Kineococcus rubinsiae]NIZ92811.1 DUF1810 domain-containing protein [Kineococcus rubinsiae]